MLSANYLACSKYSINVSYNFCQRKIWVSLSSFQVLQASLFPMRSKGTFIIEALQSHAASVVSVVVPMPFMTSRMKELGGSEQFFLLSSILFLI